MKAIANKYWSRFVDHHSLYLLGSLLLFIFVGPLIQSATIRETFYDGVMILIAASGFVLIPKNRRSKFFVVLFLLNVITSIIDLSTLYEPIYGVSNLIWSVFFFKVLFEIFRLSLNQNYNTSNALINSVSGYIVLGIIGATIFDFSQSLNFDPFNWKLEFFELLYVSFVTMTTLGYGDISPISVEGRTIAILITICGQLYIAVVIAINLAKYLAKIHDDEEDEKLDRIEKKLDQLLDNERKD